MRYYGYDEFKKDMKKFIINLDYKPDCIIAISRGGMTMGHFLGIALDIKEVLTINVSSYFHKQKQDLKIFNIPSLNIFQRVLIVDDIVDSGESMQKISRILQQINPDITFKTAVLFYKPTATIMPDYYIHQATGWIDFFWEVDILHSIKENNV